jgi:Spy/CpxP family protein refolding chaperone
MPRFQKVTATVCAAALLGVGGLSAAQAATSTTASGTSSASHAGRPGGPGRGGPMAAAQLAKIAKTLGVTNAQLKSALDATRPAKPTGDRPDRGAALASDLATALGVDAAQIQTILDANRPAKPADGARPAPGTRPAKPDNSKLITALATGLNLDEATVKAAFAKVDAAHKADHAAHDQAMYAAVAKQLGLSTDAVQAAFEANRPAMAAA